MNLKLARVVLLAIATIFLILLFFKSCQYWFWSEGDIDRTLAIFAANRSTFNALVTWTDSEAARDCVQDRGIQACLPPKFYEITNAGCSVSYTPFIVEAAPINFYYVLVYTKQPQHIEASDAYQDEGTLLKKVGQHWTLVRRGWM